MMKEGIYLVRARRSRTTNLVYNYDYWRCPFCNWHPGGEEGPPAEQCSNCGGDLYTKDPELAAHTIEVFRTSTGLGFKFRYGLTLVNTQEEKEELMAARFGDISFRSLPADENARVLKLNSIRRPTVPPTPDELRDVIDNFARKVKDYDDD